MANTCHEYIPNYATITAPLRDLTKKNSTFEWKVPQQKAFEQLKKKLTQTPVMAYYDTNKRSLVIVDGSPHGVSAILAQRDQQGQPYKIISYASRALSSVEKRYSQTDIEGLALVWGIEHFRMFLLGSEFDVITDHRALEAIFNNPRSNPPARIQRWMLRLQLYNFRVIYQKGLLNEADYLSRHPTSTTQTTPDEEQIAEEHVNFIINHAIPKHMTIEEVKEATARDPVLTRVKQSMQSGRWDDQDPELKPYKQCVDELTLNKSEDILLKGTRLVIPAELQERATALGHLGHQGLEKTKSLLREKIWYPNMDKRVHEMIDKCVACQAVGPSSAPQPMELTPTSDTTWESVAIDFYGPIPQTGEYLLVVIDTYSKFPEVEIVNSIEARACIPKLDKIFATHGLPKKLKTDNGPLFNGHEYERYMNVLGIEWQTSTPHWPLGNANAESFMKPLGKLMKTAQIEGKKWKQELQRFLLSYRSTPHATTKVASCVLLFNRTIRGQLPELEHRKALNKHAIAKENIRTARQKNQDYYDKQHRVQESAIQEGDTVICLQQKKNKLTPRFDPEPLTVTTRKYNMVTAEATNGRTVTRNISHFKKVDREDSDDECGDLQAESEQEKRQTRKSERIRRPIMRYGYDL